MKVLLVEDEVNVASFIQRGLSEAGYEVAVAMDGNTGFALASEHQFAVILLDIMLPGISGLEVCSKLRQMQKMTPVLMLTALGSTENVVTGLDPGADDYLVKPFEFKELLARIKALTKRAFIQSQAIENIPSNILSVADLQLDLDRKVAIRGTKVISLTAKEFSLLEYLMRNKGRVLSKPDIAERVWEVTFDTGTNVVEVYVNILRKKIDNDFPNKLIHTRVGMGYVIQELS